MPAASLTEAFWLLGLGLFVTLGGILLIANAESVAAESRKQFGDKDDPIHGPKGKLEKAYLAFDKRDHFLRSPTTVYEIGGLMFVGGLFFAVMGTYDLWHR